VRGAAGGATCCRGEKTMLGRRGKWSKRQRGECTAQNQGSQKRGHRTDPELDLVNALGRVDGSQIVTRCLVKLRNFTPGSSLNINTCSLFAGSTTLLHSSLARQTDSRLRTSDGVDVCDARLKPLSWLRLQAFPGSRCRATRNLSRVFKPLLFRTGTVLFYIFEALCSLAPQNYTPSD